MQSRIDWSRAVGILLVLGLHGAALLLLWQQRLLPASTASETLFVDLFTPEQPQPPEPERPRPPPTQTKPEPPPAAPPQPVQLAVAAPVVQPAEPVAYAPPPPPAPPMHVAISTPPPELPAPPPPKPLGPLQLGGDLALSCPERSPPRYPALARRAGEQGRVLLRVELDETGAVARVAVEHSSGSARLDEAAAAALRTWHCTPARRDGAPVRAVALQPFNFILEGH